MQSGISASKELLSAFQSFVADPKLRGLIAVIENESIVPGPTISTAGSFLEDLEQLRNVLTAKRPSYVLVRRYDDETPAFVPVTYMPDGAKVSQKTLFASTKDTFLRQLGTEKFGRPLFATELEDLLDRDFWGMDGKVPAPLTQEEQSSKELRDAEISTGSSVRRSIVSTGLTAPISEEAMQALKEVRPGGFVNLVQLAISIDSNKEATIVLARASHTKVNELKDAISDDSPRYSFYVWEHTHEGSTEAPVVFVYTCPAASPFKEKPVYAACRSSVVLAAKSLGMKIDRELEAELPSDINLQDEFHPKQEEKKAFQRPKRPGRR